MENLKKDVNNEIDRNAQDFYNSDSVNLSLSRSDFLTISVVLGVYAQICPFDKAYKDEVSRLHDVCFNIHSEMCSDDEIAVEDGAVVYKHG